MTPTRRSIVSFVAALAVVVTVLVGSAGGAPIGTWTAWSGGSSTLSLAPAVGLGPGAAATTSTSPSVPGGTTLFLGADTPFGARFGSTQGRPYAQVGLAPGNAPSTTTVTFPSPSPDAGWGFALGDIDADSVTITANGPGGPLPVSSLGFQSVFNLCANTPKPSGCGSPTPTDTPSWNAATGTLTGSGTDTVGASGWFTPGAGVTSLTFTFSRQIGFPSYNLWFAVNTNPVSGTVETDGCSSAEGVSVALQLPDGTPVLDPAGEPLTTVTGADGTWSFPAVVAGAFVVAVDAPPGCAPDPETGAAPAPVDEGPVEGIELAIVVAEPATTSTTTAPPGGAGAVVVTPAFTG